MKIISKFTNILFVDIETVSVTKDFHDLSEPLAEAWTKKSERLYPDILPAEAFTEKGAIFSEFGKIVCISCGFVYESNGEYKIRTKSFYGESEPEIIQAFFDLVDQYFTKQFQYFCGHNIKEFDIPYICRRALVNHLALPPLLHISGKKPWELDFMLDTLQLWRFGDYKAYISLDLMHALLLGYGAKNEIDGSQVTDYYWNKEDLESIKNYCEEDVKAVVRIYFELYAAYFHEKPDISNLDSTP